jgi:O-methyltransferase involved in polyketide biosynthesis
VKFDFHGMEASLLAPLWARAKFSREFPTLFNDEKAVALVDQLAYDFTAKDAALRLEGVLAIVARAWQLDDKIRAYILKHPKASVINIGAGLDTTFYRVDNGSMQWYDLDLPRVIEVRRQMLPEPERTTYLSESLFDDRWCSDIADTSDGVFLFAGGVLEWFDGSRVKQFFSLLADHFPAEMAFNTQSRLGKIISNWGVRRTGVKGVAPKSPINCRFFHDEYALNPSLNFAALFSLCSPA